MVDVHHRENTDGHRKDIRKFLELRIDMRVLAAHSSLTYLGRSTDHFCTSVPRRLLSNISIALSRTFFPGKKTYLAWMTPS